VYTGCNDISYKTFTYPEDDPHFSFEYPSHYETGNINTRYGELVPLSFILYVPDNDPLFEKPFYLLSEFEITVSPPDIDNAETTIEDIITRRKEGDPNFQLLNEDSIIISGVEAQHVSFSYTYQSIIDNKNYTKIDEIVVFEQGQMAWKIAAYYDEKVADEKEAEFQHLINTFNIIKDF
jgi:hypothetical protein